MVHDDVLDTERGQSIGGVLFCVLVAGVKDDARSAIYGLRRRDLSCL